MARTIGIGYQDFEQVIIDRAFYIDKTAFIKEWWENLDSVTLITRPRRFGKTLTMSMLEKFFSVKYAGRGDLFEGLSIWQEEAYRKLQGTYPVISLSFANVKETNYENTRRKICQLLTNEYSRNIFLLEGDLLTAQEKDFFQRVTVDMSDTEATLALNHLSEYLYRYYGKKVIILLDEYDTPMQEAYIHGYWNELVSFTRSMFNAAFKTNPSLGRAIMTGITRVSKESIFSDLNNLEVVTTTSCKYEDVFGFTQPEVTNALQEYNLSAMEDEVKAWYDGFTFGNRSDIYNPWSILNYLEKQTFTTYWANTSSNSLAGRLIREGSADVKMIMEDLLKGRTLHTQIDEQIVFNQLNHNENAIWSLLLASGYLKVAKFTADEVRGRLEYDLMLTNKEVRIMFENMINDWFSGYTPAYNDFVKALLRGDRKAMNAYMNRVALATFSFFRRSNESKPSLLGLDDCLRVPDTSNGVWNFDTGKRPSEATEPERFYHGFVLGLMVDLADRYVITSNRESGFGRYDVLLEPLTQNDDAIILEFKVYDPEEEKDLKETVAAALSQIENHKYGAALEAKGIAAGRIRKYGFAFKGKKVLIG